MKTPIIITIDGPAGAGKSTIAKLLARKLRFHYLDTGALYRAVTLKAIKDTIKLSDRKAIAKLVSNSNLEMKPLSWESRSGKNREKILLDGVDITREIRTPQITASVSKISSFPIVRKAMVRLQKKIARGKNIVCEGRDMGSVVFPDAYLKFYLDASLKERAKRRYQETTALFPGKKMSYHRVFAEISKRDYSDTHRKTAPLVKPSDSFCLDTTSLSIKQVVNVLMKIIYGKLNKK